MRASRAAHYVECSGRERCGVQTEPYLPTRTPPMTTLQTIAAAALISALAATPVFAQAAIGEPGAFAFYHPDADVLNGGARFQQPAPSSPYQAYAAAPGAVLNLKAQHHRARHSSR